MKPTQEEIAKRLDAEKARRVQDKVVDIWRPTITDREQEERKQQIDRGILPF